MGSSLRQFLGAGVARLAAGRAALLGALACTAAGCSLLLDFDEADLSADGSQIDAASADAAVDGPDSPNVLLEPNDLLGQARALSSAVGRPLAIDPTGDQDYFFFNVAAQAVVTLRVTFEHAQGDLDLYLFAGAGSPVAESVGFTDDEILSRELPVGDYFVLVRGATNMVVNDYLIEISGL